MIRVLLLTFVFCYAQVLFSQTENTITLTLNNTPIKEAVLEIESQINYEFYFQEDWFGDVTLTESFTNASLNEVLFKLFNQTSINYHIIENRVILSNNSYIYPSLPKDFFNKNGLSASDEDKGAVFYNEYETNSSNGKLITIGKQNNNSNQSLYTITGYVKNESTKKPIQNLVISTNNKTNYTTTNSKGYFSLEVPAGINEIETNLLGYETTTKNVLVYGNGDLNFEVLEGAEQLDEILIAAKKNDNIKTAVVGVTTIDMAGLKNIPVVLGERDVLKIATTMPGVKTAGEGSSGFNVRGGRTDQNLILLDNAVIYSPSHFLGFFSALNPFTTGSLDIYKASIPA
uniref:carboxypeptidase-like regulatory domain-containing protein n=1 Tax=Bizionia echini TaxID=649333 RepID=UPI0030DCF9D0